MNETESKPARLSAAERNAALASIRLTIANLSSLVAQSIAKKSLPASAEIEKALRPLDAMLDTCED